MNQLEIRKQKALDIVNGFISEKGKKTLTKDEFDDIIALLNVFDARSGVIRAIKYLRHVTGTETATLWITDYEVLGTPDGSNPLVEYMVKNGLTEAGTFETKPALCLQDAGLVVRFIQNNLSLLTQ